MLKHFFKKKPEPGLYNGKHYTEWVETVKHLRRDDKDGDAETLLLHLVAATEEEAVIQQGNMPPWYTEQLAIVYRKRQDYTSEINIMKRYRQFVLSLKDTRGANTFDARIQKAQTLHDKKSI